MAASTAEPKTVVEHIREAERSRLEGCFAEFITDADPEDISLMHRIMTFWEHGIAAGADAMESVLAECFMDQLDRDDSYIRVPRQLAPHIEAYATG